MRLRYLLAVAALCIGCASATTDTSTQNTDTRAAGPITVAWESQVLAPGPYDQPRFSLAIKMSGAVNESVKLGEFGGSFSTGVTLTGPFQDPILTGVSWWAGAGDEFAVQHASPTSVQVWHREIDEESEGGQPRILQTIAIPAGSTVEAAL